MRPFVIAAFFGCALSSALTAQTPAPPPPAQLGIPLASRVAASIAPPAGLPTGVVTVDEVGFGDDLEVKRQPGSCLFDVSVFPAAPNLIDFHAALGSADPRPSASYAYAWTACKLAEVSGRSEASAYDSAGAAGTGVSSQERRIEIRAVSLPTGCYSADAAWVEAGLLVVAEVAAGVGTSRIQAEAGLKVEAASAQVRVRGSANAEATGTQVVVGSNGYSNRFDVNVSGGAGSVGGGASYSHTSAVTTNGIRVFSSGASKSWGGEGATDSGIGTFDHLEVVKIDSFIALESRARNLQPSQPSWNIAKTWVQESRALLRLHVGCMGVPLAGADGGPPPAACDGSLTISY